ncbi:unnamed protein product [Spirodela intermedia]|uniref:Uncharacterized protein n=1 Tax=Spirodela intermedia TaxID=51605 RepID=A0A7I8JBQ9_SPIIN|nr:unnamed protein product [Spirodela intermedia]CAA6667175.1 unnamed protein product [Spirodela intermedia]
MQYIPATAPKFDRSMKWVVESSPAAVTRRSGKTATLRWRLVSRRIVLFPTTACSSINRR